jgi:hypothetical protein
MDLSEIFDSYQNVIREAARPRHGPQELINLLRAHRPMTDDDMDLLADYLEGRLRRRGRPRRERTATSIVMHDARRHANRESGNAATIEVANRTDEILGDHRQQNGNARFIVLPDRSSMLVTDWAIEQARAAYKAEHGREPPSAEDVKMMRKQSKKRRR